MNKFNILLIPYFLTVEVSEMLFQG